MHRATYYVGTVVLACVLGYAALYRDLECWPAASGTYLKQALPNVPTPILEVFSNVSTPLLRALPFSSLPVSEDGTSRDDAIKRIDVSNCIDVASSSSNQFNTSNAFADAISLGPHMNNSGSVPVVGTYIISMNQTRYMLCLDHLRNLGMNTRQIFLHPGVFVDDAVMRSSWVRDLIPQLDEQSSRHGNVGLALAHLTMWRRLGLPGVCGRSGATRLTSLLSREATDMERACEDHFALVLEDDERPKQEFAKAVRSVIALLQASRSTNLAMPDLVNLNVLRPNGTLIFNIPETNASLLQYYKIADIGSRYIGGRPNIWLSAYLVRCGAIRTLLEDMGNDYNGNYPTFDQRVIDKVSGFNSTIQMAAISPTNVISEHIEGFDSRKRLNKH